MEIRQHERQIRGEPSVKNEDNVYVSAQASAERALRNVTIGRRSYLFAGSNAGGKRAAAKHSVIESAKLNGVKPSLKGLLGQSRPIAYRSTNGRYKRWAIVVTGAASLGCSAPDLICKAQMPHSAASYPAEKVSL